LVDVFYKKFGFDYIDLAFQIARETDPSAKLIYNAGDNETSAAPTTQQTRLIVDRLRAKGLIDGVGLEMHLDATQTYDKEDVITTMKSYGVPVHVTEIDVDLTNVKGAQEERYARQAQVYGDMLSACLESGVCKSFSVWGIGDKNSWLERESSNADPTLFDDNLNPKPAYFAILNALR
jgi:endo-1,4-beta-xylanase